jgi:3-methyladenine DNA glycosylase AlkD
MGNTLFLVDAKHAANRLEKALRQASTPERAENEKRYLKSDLEFLGTRVPAIRRETKLLFRKVPDDVWSLVDELWGRGIHELRMAAVFVLEACGSELEAEDLPRIEVLLRASRTWALVDALAANVVGPLVERETELAHSLDRWATDEDFWIRRSALLAHLVPLRRGEGDFDRFSRYADAMLDEREFFIRKAIGWVLRETSKKRPDLVVEWLGPRADRASGITMREAVRHLPDVDAARLMALYRGSSR